MLGPAGEVDRDPLREHGRDVARPRPGPLRRARPEARRHDHRSARAHDRRRRRVPGDRRVPAVLHADDGAERVPNAEDRVQLAGRDHQHHAGRGVPRRRPARGDAPRRAHARHRRRRARHRSRSRSGARTSSRPTRSRTRTVTGATYDSGEYEKALDAVLEHAGYDALRAEQAARRERGDPMLLGIGVASYVEITAPVGLHRECGQGRDRRRRHGARVRRHQRARPGSRDRVLDDRQRRARRPDGGRARPAVRHRDHPAGRRHRRVALAPDRRERAARSRARRCSRRRSSSRRTCSRPTPTTS